MEPTTLTKKELSVRGVRIHYLDSELPKAKTLVFIHGWGQSSECFVDTACTLAPHARVIVPDLPGFGYSDTPPTHWNYQDYADVVVDFCTQLDAAHPLFIGHSFGAKIALIAAVRMSAPEVVVYSSDISSTTSWFRTINTLLIQLLKRFVPNVLFWMHTALLHPTTYTNHFAWNTERSVRMLTLYTQLRFDSKILAQKSDARTVHIFVGRHDYIARTNNLENFLQSHLTWRHTITEFETSGHFSHSTEPHKFVEALLRIIKKG